MKLNLRKIGRGAWGREKLKAAAFLKLAEKLGAKQIIKQMMQREWYRHIDKALAAKLLQAMQSTGKRCIRYGSRRS